MSFWVREHTIDMGWSAQAHSNLNCKQSVDFRPFFNNSFSDVSAQYFTIKSSRVRWKFKRIFTFIAVLFGKNS